jgi:signal transduction histidine kinase
MKFLSLSFFAAGIAMIPRDLSDLSDLANPWTTWHLVLRGLCLVGMVVFFVRAFQHKVENYHFQLYFFIGLVYAGEGTIFNPSYYLAYIQVILGVSLLSTLPRQKLYPYLPLCLISYLGTLFALYQLGTLSADLWVDYSVACLIATLGGVFGVILRDHCLRVYEGIALHYVEANGRLIDLGSDVGTICHDMKGLLRTLKTNLTLIERQSGAIDPIRDRFEPIKRATDHMIRLQEFVLSMCKKEGEAVSLIGGTELDSLLRTLVPDFCSAAVGYLTFHCDTTRVYRCSPTAICYAVVNAVRNSAEAGRAAENKDLSIAVRVGLEEQAMIVSIQDNGPGFPEDVLKDGFSNQLSTKLETGGTGMGLSNMLRYIGYQGGSVEIKNSKGALVIFRIPQTMPTS